MRIKKARTADEKSAFARLPLLSPGMNYSCTYPKRGKPHKIDVRCSSPRHNNGMTVHVGTVITIQAGEASKADFRATSARDLAHVLGSGAIDWTVTAEQAAARATRSAQDFRAEAAGFRRLVGVLAESPAVGCGIPPISTHPSTDSWVMPLL